MHPMHVQTLSQSLAKEDWTSLAVLLNRIDLSNIQNKQLKRRVLTVKSILNVHLNTLNGHGTIDASLLIGSLRTLAALEKDFGSSDHDFLVFMKTLIYKFEKQRLLVDKVLEKRLEFKKMKGAIDS
ncbi:MAG: hypothetical protein V1492_00665 [Candidatus Micrarchaeota archaeon]